MFSKIVTSALFAGFGAGLLAALLQYAFVQPILLHAELYETGALTHPAGAMEHMARSFDFARDGMTVFFTVLIYTAYALMLLAAMAFANERGHALTPKIGLVWGIAGFIAVQLAPAAGLAPELPGMLAADLELRQIWWFGTVIATAVGLWLVGFGQNWTMWGIAIILLAAPHIIGAPMLDTMTGPAPPELASEFAARALAVGLAAWATLGLLAAYFWQQEGTQ